MGMGSARAWGSIGTGLQGFGRYLQDNAEKRREDEERLRKERLSLMMTPGVYQEQPESSAISPAATIGGAIMNPPTLSREFDVPQGDPMDPPTARLSVPGAAGSGEPILPTTTGTRSQISPVRVPGQKAPVPQGHLDIGDGLRFNPRWQDDAEERARQRKVEELTDAFVGAGYDTQQARARAIGAASGADITYQPVTRDQQRERSLEALGDQRDLIGYEGEVQQRVNAAPRWTPPEAPERPRIMDGYLVDPISGTARPITDETTGKPIQSDTPRRQVAYDAAVRSAISVLDPNGLKRMTGEISEDDIFALADRIVSGATGLAPPASENPPTKREGTREEWEAVFDSWPTNAPSASAAPGAPPAAPEGRGMSITDWFSGASPSGGRLSGQYGPGVGDGTAPLMALQPGASVPSAANWDAAAAEAMSEFGDGFFDEMSEEEIQNFLETHLGPRPRR
jgi:hypothetical protein